MSKTANTLDTELTNTLGYLIDKFNLTLEISSQEIKEFSSRMATKIIAWELGTSIFKLLALTAIIITILMLFKKYKIKRMTTIFKQLDEETDNIKQKVKETISLSVQLGLRFGAYLIFAISTGTIARAIFKIFTCIAFPEKVILDFIGNYL